MKITIISCFIMLFMVNTLFFNPISAGEYKLKANIQANEYKTIRSKTNINKTNINKTNIKKQKNNIKTQGDRVKQSIFQPPIAKVKEHITKIHNKVIKDPYFWLKDKKDPDTLKYLKAENRYTQSIMKDTKDLQKTLFKEIKGRIREDDQSVPIKKDNYYYYSRMEKKKEYPIYCRRRIKDSSGLPLEKPLSADFAGSMFGPGLQKTEKFDLFKFMDTICGPEEIFFDMNQSAKDQSYLAMGSAFGVSPDHKTLAYSLDFDGSEAYTLYFRDLTAQHADIKANKSADIKAAEPAYTKVKDIKAVKMVSELCWSNDSSAVYYSVVDKNMRPYRVYRHIMGQTFENDELLFEEKDEAYFVGLDKSKSRQWLFIVSASSVASEVYGINLNEDAPKLTLLWERRPETEVYFYHRDLDFYIRTNENALNFKICKAPVSLVIANKNQALFSEVIPENENRPIMDIDLFQNFMVIYEMKSGLDFIRIQKFEKNKTQSFKTQSFMDLEFPDLAYSAEAYSNPDYLARTLLVSYESMTRPESVYEFDMISGRRRLIRQFEVRGGYDPEKYNAERFMIRATDGTMVPVSLVYKRELFKKDGSNPCYLYGYGAYGVCSEPGFYSSVISLLDRGFVYAIAHVRGSSAMGFNWHESGKMLQKRNTFTDFINAAEYLVAKGYTSSEKIAIEGGSAGGLLMGAVTNMRPELFGAVIADVPFVDVVNTMLDSSLPLTVTEYDEWGNPNEKPYFDYILTYCPYSNVKAREYPDMLVLAGLNDPRVSYWEPAKFVARIRSVNQSDNTVLLKTNMDAGHGGASGRYEYYKDTAFKFAFILKCFKLFL